MFCLASFGVLFAVWCSVADTHLKLLDCIVSDASFLTGGVFQCDIVHRRSVAVLCMLYKIRSNPIRCTLSMVPFLWRMCRCGLHAALWSHIGTLMRLLAAEPRCIAGLLFPCQYLRGTILVTWLSMVWVCWIYLTFQFVFFCDTTMLYSLSREG